MTLRDDLLPMIDGLRGLFTQFGVARYTVAIRRVTWSGGRRGLGTPTPVDTPIVDSTGGSPLVVPVSTAEIASSGGTYGQGDLKIVGITPRYTTPTTGGYTPAQLQPVPASDAQEVFYVLIGDEGEMHCTVVDSRYNDPVEYTLVVRRRRDTP